MSKITNNLSASYNRQLSEEAIRDALDPDYKDIPLHIYNTIDSTNIKAKELALGGSSDWTVVLSSHQSAGRGRLGRSFFSPPEGLYLSIIIKPDFDVSQSVLITSAAAVAVCEAIEKVTGQIAQIKWVNDVYINNKKVCGILTEGVSNPENGQIETLITGIGVNTTLKDFPQDLLPIAGAVDGDYSISHLAAAIINKTLDYSRSIAQRKFIDEYRKRNIAIGKTVTVYKGRYRINPEDEIDGVSARVLGIDNDGKLDIIYSDGTREFLSSGEVTLRLT